MSAKIVNVIGFVEHGKSHPKFTKKKGNVSSETLVGYQNYTSRETSRDEEFTAEFVEGYIQYTTRESSRSDKKNIRTFTHKGWIDNEEELRLFKDEIHASFSKDGNLAWMPITSYKDYLSAEEYGLYTEEDYAALTSEVLNRFFKHVGLDPDNMIWWMDYHTNKDHPHTHVVFLEKKQTRTRGKFTQKEIDFYKGAVLTAAKKRGDLINGIKADNTLFKNKDKLLKNLRTVTSSKVERQLHNKLNKDILNLYKILPEASRLQYNSYHMKPYKKFIDKSSCQIKYLDNI